MKYAVLIQIILALAFSVYDVSSHINSHLLPDECGSCHVGHGLSDQPMLNESEEDFCFQCHGSENKRTAMIANGKLSPAAMLKDLESEFRKPFRHPVEEGFGHSPTEKLPSFSGSQISHAECVDCHNPHQRIQAGSNQAADVSGYSLSGQYLESSMHEYEICLKCHSGIYSFDRSKSDPRREFSPSVRSQHPVTIAGVGKRLPSLKTMAGHGTLMKCSDCHTNDNPDGPRGPHGSNHESLLSGNYTRDVFAEESQYAYEFCYSCHDRVSILSDESFPLHSEHIVGDLFKEVPGTSCYTCHASHGSQNNLHLIEFNPEAVTGDAKTGIIQYRSSNDGSGQCYLTCHGYAHSPAEY